jgi:hypothetical protein
VEVKSIRAANIKKTHEKLKAQIENRKLENKESIDISMNSANRVFGELMESSIKKSLNITASVVRPDFVFDEKNAFHLFGNRTGLSVRVGQYEGPHQMNDIMGSIQETSELRMNKAKDILRKIKEGTYAADYLTIADKLLSRDVVMRI